MNLRRGLFRLWIVGAALFVIAVASVSYGNIKAEFDAVARAPAAQLEEEPNRNGNAVPPATKIVVFEGQRYAFPAAATDKEIAAALESATVNPWTSVGRVAGIAFGIPLAVLALGASLVWAFSGFAAPRS